MVALARDEFQQQRVIGEQRESIWSVSKGVKNVYFALFIVQFGGGTIWTVAQGVESPAALWHDLSALAVTAAAAETLRGADAEWEAWLQRRMQAEQRGEPFEEPPPSARRGAAEVAKQ